MNRIDLHTRTVHGPTEWQVDGPSNSARLWIDGAALPEIDAGPASRMTCTMGSPPPPGVPAPTFDHAHVGWENVRTATIPVELWIDDVAIDSKRIGCPPR